MRILAELVSGDVGLVSAAGLVFMLGMGVFYVRYFLKSMPQDAQPGQRSQ
jgi:hypothetical protein